MLRMRIITRLHALSAAAILAVLYFGCTLPSMRIKTRIERAWKGNIRQIVVFGDGWSDIGEYRIAPPKEAARPVRDDARGLLWTEVLCKEV
jgi:hypothetical protein